MRAALPRGPVHPRLRAQNDARRFASFDPGFTVPVTGAFSLLPVALLYLARPLAVNPPPRFTLSFSPLLTLRLGEARLRAIYLGPNGHVLVIYLGPNGHVLVIYLGPQ